MSKIKIVQIVMAASQEEFDYQYLDDKGRVWLQDGHWEMDSATSPGAGKHWVSEWKLLELPEEPKL